MAKLNVEGFIVNHLQDGATNFFAVQQAAVLMRNASGAQSSFRDRNEFLDNCLECAISKFHLVFPDSKWEMTQENKNEVLKAMGFDFVQGNRLMKVSRT
jgi:hypothetical protein